MQQLEFNVSFILRSIKKYSKTFIAINFFVVTSAIIYTFLTPVQYESKAIFYPYSPESSDPRIMLYDEASFSVFGYSDQVERYSKIGKSNRIKFYLANKYNLYQRYKIKTDSMKLAKFEILEELGSNVLKFGKGENGAVIVTVQYFDRDTAAMMCNDVVEQIDSTVSAFLIEKNTKVFNLYAKQFSQLAQGIDDLKDSIGVVMKSKSPDKLEIVKMLQSQINFSLEEYTKAKTKYELSKTLTSRQLKMLLLVESAEPSFKKSIPNKKLIIGSAFTISLLFSTFVCVVFAYVKENRKKFSF